MNQLIGDGGSIAYVPEIGVINTHDSNVTDGQSKPRICYNTDKHVCLLALSIHTLLYNRVAHGTTDSTVSAVTFGRISIDECLQ